MSIKGFKSKDGKIHKYDYDALENVPENSGSAAVELDTTLTQSGKAADAKAVGDAISKVSGGNADQSGVSGAVLQAIYDNLSVTAFDSTQMTQEQYNANLTIIKAAIGGDSGGEEEPDEPVIPEVTLTSISATYSGGDVPVGTALTDLTDIVVTAHYSDGTSAPVIEYTLSGEIVEGSNTITVSYSGKTTTIMVTGIAEETTERVWLANTENASIKNTYGGDAGAVVSITNHNTVDFTANATVNSKIPISISDSGYYTVGSNLTTEPQQALNTYMHLSVGDVVTVEATINSFTVANFFNLGFMLGKTGEKQVSNCIKLSQAYGMTVGAVRTASVTIEEECDVSWFGFFFGQSLGAGDTFNVTLSVKVNDVEILG